MLSAVRRSIGTVTRKRDERGRDAHSPRTPASRSGEPRATPRPRSEARVSAILVALDVLTLGLFVLCLVIVATGGWHLHLAHVRASFGSWPRILAWALALGLLRHFVVPRPTMAETLSSKGRLAASRLVAAARAFRWQPAWRAVVVPVVTSRMMVYAVGLIALGAFGLGRDAQRYQFFANPFLNLLARWDANWYTGIATHGYHWNGNPHTENPVVFFPAYPMLVRAGAWLTGADAAYVGFGVSMAAFAWALTYVFRLARDEFRLDAPGAAVSMLAWYPFAVFFGAVYAESLFLLALTGGFYHALQRERWRSAAWALLASLTKPNGFLLAAPLAVVFAVRWWRESGHGWRLWRDRDAARAALADGLILLAPLLGIGGYSLFVWGLTGDPLAWLHGQQAWDRTPGSPVGLLVGLYRIVAEYGLARVVLMWPAHTLNTIAVVFALAAVVPVWRRLGLASAVLILVLTVPPLLAGGVMSMGRFTSCLFPIFIWLAADVPARHRGTVYAVFAAGQALVAAMFLTWRTLY